MQFQLSTLVFAQPPAFVNAQAHSWLNGQVVGRDVAEDDFPGFRPDQIDKHRGELG